MVLFVFSTILYLAVQTSAASADQWKSRSIYQLVTDRFATSDSSAPPCDTSKALYCGGTWTGIANKLDYIQGMGFDAVWISPIVKNIENLTAYGEAYHGYWSQDLTSLNPHFGSEDSLNALSKALHDRGMYLLLDVVVNHVATSALPTPFEEYTPFNQPADFHPFCFITDYNNQTDVEQCSLGDDKVALADLNTEDPDVVSGMSTWIKDIVQKYNIDGLRLDTVKHVRKEFWPGFVQSAGVWTVGEVLDGRTSYVGDYTNYIDSVLDYPGYFALKAAFTNPSGNISALVDVFQQTQATYKGGAFSTASFLENQDNPRFQNITSDPSLVKNAIAWTFVTDGVPILYYGQEQGFKGGGDPANREALWPSKYQTKNSPLVSHITALNKARKAAIKASTEFLSTPTKIINHTPNSLTLSKPPLLAFLTNVGSSSLSTWGIPAGSGSSAQGQNSSSPSPSSSAGSGAGGLIDIISCTPLKAGSDTISSPNGEPIVLMPTSLLPGSGLCDPNSDGGGGGKGTNGAVSSTITGAVLVSILQVMLMWVWVGV